MKEAAVVNVEWASAHTLFDDGEWRVELPILGYALDDGSYEEADGDEPEILRRNPFFDVFDPETWPEWEAVSSDDPAIPRPVQVAVELLLRGDGRVA